MNNLLNGLILCGGKSSRMGKDKSQISYHGKPQREYLADLLKPICSAVFFSTPLGSKVSQTTIPDHFQLESPLNGILSAFHFDPDAVWLTMPVDIPNINSKAIEFIIKHRDHHKVATCFLDSDGQNPEPLFAIWEPRSRPMLFDFFNHGETSPRKFLIENDVQLLKAPSNSLFVNINTEDDLTSYFSQKR